jgi:hypothetical protein
MRAQWGEACAGLPIFSPRDRPIPASYCGTSADPAEWAIDGFFVERPAMDQFRLVGHILGVAVRDHVVIGYDRYASFPEEGWL